MLPQQPPRSHSKTETLAPCPGGLWLFWEHQPLGREEGWAGHGEATPACGFLQGGLLMAVVVREGSLEEVLTSLSSSSSIFF